MSDLRMLASPASGRISSDPPAPSRIPVLKILLWLAVVEVLSLFFFRIIRGEHLLPGILVVAAAYLALVALVLWCRRQGGLAWPFSYAPSLARVSRPRRREVEFARLTGQVDSYLSNTSRPDEIHPVVVELVRDRLERHHGIDLADEARARSLLGQELAGYVYSPPRAKASGRTYARLNMLLTRIEEL